MHRLVATLAVPGLVPVLFLLSLLLGVFRVCYRYSMRSIPVENAFAILVLGVLIPDSQLRVLSFVFTVHRVFIVFLLVPTCAVLGQTKCRPNSDTETGAGMNAAYHMSVQPLPSLTEERSHRTAPARHTTLTPCRREGGPSPELVPRHSPLCRACRRPATTPGRRPCSRGRGRG